MRSRCRPSTRAHSESFGDAGKAGKSLRARGAGNEAELYFRLAHLRAENGHAKLAPPSSAMNSRRRIRPPHVTVGYARRPLA